MLTQLKMAPRLRICGKLIGGVTFCGFCTVQALKKFKSRDINAFASENEEGNSYELIHAQVAFRHGARTPLFRLPKMDGRGKTIEEVVWDKNVIMGELPYTDVKYIVRNYDGTAQPKNGFRPGKQRLLKGGSPLGHLTKVGEQQTYDLGKNLHQRYIRDFGLVTPGFSAKEIYLRTTNVPRTLQSLKCVIAGMYGQENIPGTVVMVTKALSKETMIPNLEFCPLLHQWMRNTMERSFVGYNLNDYEKDKEIFKKELGITSGHFLFVFFRDNIMALKAHNIPVDDVFMEFWDMIDKHALQELVMQQCGYPSGSQQDILSLGVGKFLEEILDRMKDKINGSSPDCHKMCLYSTHDTAVTCLLVAMGVFDNKWPDFAAYIAFELYKNKKEEYFVKVLYQGKELTLPGCESPYCPFQKFKDIITPYFIEDWETECQYLHEDS